MNFKLYTHYNIMIIFVLIVLYSFSKISKHLRTASPIDQVLCSKIMTVNLEFHPILYYNSRNSQIILVPTVVVITNFTG